LTAMHHYQPKQENKIKGYVVNPSGFLSTT